MRKHLVFLSAAILGAFIARACIVPTTAQTLIANNASDMAGKIVMVADSPTGRTVTNLFTFDRDPSAPYAVSSGSAKVTNLDADKLDGEEGTAYHSATNLTGTIALARLTLGVTTVVSNSSTGTQNNWAPGLSGDTAIFWSGGSSLTVTGFAGGVSGQRIVFVNTGLQVAAFSHNSGSSSAGNKLGNHATTLDTSAAAGGVLTYQYDGAIWQLVTHQQGAAITYTTTWANSGTANAIGNGTLSASYFLSGRRLTYLISLTWGSTTTSGSGTWNFSIPATMVNDVSYATIKGLDSSASSNYMGMAFFNTTTTVLPTIISAGILAVCTTTTPFTWATGDTLGISGTVSVS